MEKIILVIISIVIIVVVLLVLAGNYLYNFSLNPNTSKDAIFDVKKKDEKEISNKNNIDEDEKVDEKVDEKEDVHWIMNASHYIDVFIKSFDGLKLYGYKIVNSKKSNKWVIIVHGYTGEGISMGSRAKAFYNMGYNVIIPDLRGHGKSEGNYIGMGWHDRKDILSWIEYIIKNYKDSEIVLYGISMGASTVMMTSGENIQSNVKAIIEDCGYTCAWDELSYQLKNMYKLPEFPIMHMANLITKFRAGYFLKEASCLKQVSKSKTPILFIHGEEDKFVPYFMLDEIYNAAKCEKDILVVHGAAHCKAHKVNPELYWGTIKHFVNKYLS